MKKLIDYLAESVREYNYKIKILGQVNDDIMVMIENELKKYDLKTINAPVKTIYQNRPLDFDEGISGEVNIISFKTGIALPKDQVRDIIAIKIGLPERYLKIRSENDPIEYDLVDNDVETEVTVDESDPKDSVLLNDYEKDQHKAEDYYGNEYRNKFVDELTKIIKKRKQHVSNYMNKNNDS